ncbi:unnamed protein product [Adineta ricciae]|uniref:Uncharacterized protein n=1 Tax=Adineta ricciae TaxID=249248 RepID=A0A815V512_ADIRI|nr:unnamed protein product [Adineta ricciae]CAF1630166.1 unnamed protein product [Adineta ricciae]
MLLYNTESSDNVEQFHCVYYTKDSTVKYCVRPGTNVSLSSAMNKCLHGEKLAFSELLAREVSPWEVLQWSSSVEQVDDYARLFYNRLEPVEEQSYLCNCTKEGSFGKSCEYELLFDPSSFSKALQKVFDANDVIKGHQIWGSILFYVALVCDYGLLCLDWRNICDGAQNCMDGHDEENCDLLEFNECEDDEYRCVDGMCISEEYWLDGELDDKIPL